MRYFVLYLVLWIMVIHATQAQQNVQQFRVHFNTDESIVDQQDQRILLQVVQQFKQAPYAEITLSAHTDNDANQEYNNALSKRRSESVIHFLTKHGVPLKQIISSVFGENKPITANLNSDAKQQNRRVDISIEKFAFSNTVQMLKAAGGAQKQCVTINPNIDNTISGKNGTQLTIKANTLVDSKGNLIKEPVTITLEEFLTPSAALFNSLSTQTTTGEQLETGGMFSVTASANNKPVSLKKGSEIKATLPAFKSQPDMQVFTATKNANGITTWNTTGKPFELNDKVTQLKSVSMKNMRFYFKVPAAPYEPAIPIAPKFGQKITDITYYSLFERMFVPKVIRKRTIATLNAQIEQNNKALLQDYKRKYSAYRMKYAIYQADSTNYSNKYNTSFNNWLAEQIPLQEVFLKALKADFNDSVAIEQTVVMNEKSEFITKKQAEELLKNSSINRYKFLTDKHIDILFRLEFMKSKGVVGAYQTYGRRGYVSCYDGWHFPTYTTSRYTPAAGLVYSAEETTLTNIVEAKLSGVSEEERKQIEFNYTYTGYMQSFGTINCDRFTNTPQNLMTTVKIPATSAAQVAFYIPSQQAFIYANLSGKNYEVRLPINCEYALFMTALNGMQPLLYTEKGKVETNKTIEAKLKETTITELRNLFNSI